jgi:hypothetical protein
MYNCASRVLGSGKPDLERSAKPVRRTCATGGEEVTMVPKFPHITVPLTGTDGNAFAVLGKVSRALRRAGIPQAERDAFMQQATAGDYNRLLQVVMHWVDIR